jgi:Cdc25 family phosphatase
MYDKANDLIREYSQVPKIYFHCALSQVRGKEKIKIKIKIKVLYYGYILNHL